MTSPQLQMASSLSSASAAGSYSASKDPQGVRCTVCYENFSPTVPARQPRLLSCAHTFCTECVGRLPVARKSIRYHLAVCQRIMCRVRACIRTRRL